MTQDNAKLLKSGFRGAINWNKYQPDQKRYAQSRYLDHLVNPIFQGLNRFLVSSFNKEGDGTSHWNYYLPKLEIKACNVMIDGCFVRQACWKK